MCKTAGLMENSVDSKQMLHFAASALGLHCLLRPVYSNISGYYGTCNLSCDAEITNSSVVLMINYNRSSVTLPLVR